MEKRKGIIFILIILIMIVLIGSTLAILFLTKKEINPNDVVNEYFSMINSEEYDSMYELLSDETKNEISKEDFITRNKNIYTGIECKEIKIEIKDDETIKEKDNATIHYKQSMQTIAGDVNFDNVINLVKQKDEYKIVWNSNIIFPNLTDSDKVRVSTLDGKRGRILDREGNELATNGFAYSCGIVLGKLENRDESIAQISNILEVSEERINQLLSASYVKEDTFVPIRNISYDNEEIKEKLLKIKGVMLNKVDARVYTLGEEAAHLIGYVTKVTKEDIDAHPEEGYNENSIIGKAGLEKVYEQRLKSKDGKEINIVDENNNIKENIARKSEKNGEDIILTIDSNMQKSLYNYLKEDKGLFVVMNSQTGELLSLVSTPSYNSNDFSVGMLNSKWNELNNNDAKPLYNRFAQKYAPGSTFKPITGAIALSLQSITQDDTVQYNSTSWQKDSSWGNYHVTTLTAYSEPKNLRNALRYSDNIYFAQTALKIGKENFASYLNKLGFNEEIGFPLNIAVSKYSNSDEISSEIKLADSGYGQGDILVNPIHMASIYSSFANKGNMIKPYIEMNEESKGAILKENVFSEEVADIITNDLIQVVESGTATDAKINGVMLAGKTGTAELKSSYEDTDANTLGWFNCFTVNKDTNLLFVGMVENAKENGGSHYIIKQIRNILLANN